MQKVLKLDFYGQSVTFVIHSHHILLMMERRKKNKNPLLILLSLHSILNNIYTSIIMSETLSKECYMYHCYHIAQYTLCN